MEGNFLLTSFASVRLAIVVRLRSTELTCRTRLLATLPPAFPSGEGAERSEADEVKPRKAGASAPRPENL